MVSTATLDFDRLLKPITANDPFGEDLRFDLSLDSPYQRIKDARAKARAIERRLDHGDDANDSPRPNWRTVLELAPKIIAERSKDLEVAAYLIEALAREQGFPGLEQGFRLVQELIQKYWEGLFPVPDSEGPEGRIIHISGLNGIDGDGTLIRPIQSIPITAGQSVRPLSCADVKQAQQMSTLSPAEQQRRIAEGAPSAAMLEQAVAETPRAFFIARLEEIQHCLHEYDRMCAAIDTHCAGGSSHTSNIRNTLEMVAETIRYIARLPKHPEDFSVTAPTGVPVAESEPTNRSAATPARESSDSRPHGIQSRDEALQTLLTVAEFFRRTEPHSPLSYAAEQLVRWGRLPLPDLLNELIPDNASRDYFFTLVGMELPPRQ